LINDWIFKINSFNDAFIAASNIVIKKGILI
jgi:hypothetical protein